MNHQQKIIEFIQKSLYNLIETLNNSDIILFQTKFGQKLINQYIFEQADPFILYLQFVIMNYYQESQTLLEDIFSIIGTSYSPKQSASQSIIQQWQINQIEMNSIAQKCHCINQIKQVLDNQMRELEQQMKQIRTKSSILQKPHQFPESNLRIDKTKLTQYESALVSRQVNCIYCNLAIKTEIIFLNCQHGYHKECFEHSIENQMKLKEDTPHIFCVCGKKINSQALKLFNDDFKTKIIQEKLIQNQLKYLRMNYISKYMACDNYYFCQFFYINLDSKVDREVTQVRKKEYYCPVCIGNFRFNTVCLRN